MQMAFCKWESGTCGFVAIAAMVDVLELLVDITGDADQTHHFLSFSINRSLLRSQEQEIWTVNFGFTRGSVSNLEI
jgi:hypothetical protein